MMVLRGLVLLTLFLLGTGRRSFHIGISHQDGKKQKKTRATTLEVSAEAREAFLPGVYMKAPLPYRGHGQPRPVPLGLTTMTLNPVLPPRGSNRLSAIHAPAAAQPHSRAGKLIAAADDENETSRGAAGRPKRTVVPRPPMSLAPSPPYDPTVYNPDDPIYQDDLWLLTEQVRYGQAVRGAGVGYYSSYKPSALAGNHSRAILILDVAAGGSGGAAATSASETSLRKFADKLALSCECIVLAPRLSDVAGGWGAERFAAEAWSALTYLNTVCGAESLAIVTIGQATSAAILGLLAQGALSAHAVVAVCPGGASYADTMPRAARELPVPFLAVCGGADASGADCARILRKSLSFNAQLRRDFYVAELAGAPTGDDLHCPVLPALLQGACANETLALVQSWVDRCCPEGLTAGGERRQATRTLI